MDFINGSPRQDLGNGLYGQSLSSFASSNVYNSQRLHQHVFEMNLNGSPTDYRVADHVYKANEEEHWQRNKSNVPSTFKRMYRNDSSHEIARSVIENLD